MQNSASESVKERLDKLIQTYRISFEKKLFSQDVSAPDALMDVFGLTPEKKAARSQYWSRQLGSLWEKILADICYACEPKSAFPPTGTRTTPCDILFRNFAIDTKYRMGSGDSGTLQKLSRNGRKLREAGYEPILLVFRADSLPAALSSARAGGWSILASDECFKFIYEQTGVDVSAYLSEAAK